MKVLVRVLTVLFFLLLAGAAAGVIVYFSLQAGGVSFYIEQGDERYYSGTGGKELFLQRGDTYEFSIKSLTGENVDYSVRVLSNAENSFSFVFNDELWRLYDTDDGKNDYTALFDVSEQNDMFTVTIPDELTVKKAVEQQFGGEMDASFSMSDTAYTLENECTLTVSLSSPVEGESALNDSIPYFYYKTGSPDPFYVFNNYEGGVAENGMYFSLAWFADNLGLALKDGGSHGYYAEYELYGEDAWGDVADYADWLNSLSEDIAMCVIDFSISGPYSSYEKHVTVYLNTTSYEYAANLVSVSLDEDSVVF